MKTTIISLTTALILSSCLVPKKRIAETVSAKNNEITAIKDSVNKVIAMKNEEISVQKRRSEIYLAKTKNQQETINLKNRQITQLQNPTSKMNLEKEIDKVSYSLGINIGNSLKSQGLAQVNSTVFAAALDATFNGTPGEISEEQSQQVLQAYFGKLQQEQSKVLRAEGDKFLAENSKKEGVITLPSGLQYIVMTKGTGAIPKSTDQVKTHYHGTLIDGTVFDSSVERNSPATFPVTGVIQGWVEALQLMPVGSKWKLFVPSDLAYGERGQGAIKPHSALIFEVELLEIVK